MIYPFCAKVERVSKQFDVQARESMEGSRLDFLHMRVKTIGLDKVS